MPKIARTLAPRCFSLAFVSALGCCGMAAHAQTAIFDANGKLTGCSTPISDKKPSMKIPCPDSALFVHEAQLPIERLFNERRFTELDRLYDTWCEGKDRFPDGRWKLAFFTPTFFSLFRVWRDWEQRRESIDEWRKSAPNSDAARLVDAIYWRAYAWSALDAGRSNKTSREGAALFKERIRKAKGMIESVSPRCAAKFPVQIDILSDTGAGTDALRKVFSEGAGTFPEYHSLYFAMAPYFAPRAGGSVEMFDAFAKTASDYTKGFEGAGMYARIYWSVDHDGGIPFSSKSSAEPQWSRLKAGFDDLMSRYPKSQHNLRQYLSVTCRSTDSALYRSLRSKLGPYADDASMFEPLEVCDLRHKWKPQEGS